MLRGASLAPQQRLTKGTPELPSELLNSIIGVSTHASPDYGATGSTGGAAQLSTAAPQTAGSFGSASFLARFFRLARRCGQANIPNHVPVFDANGNLTTSQTGVSTFRFRSLSLFYLLRAQSWTALITYSVLIYVLIVLLISASYYVWGTYCGAGVNAIMSIYFTVVSLAANGGYLGEDEGTMTDSNNFCYRGRTVIVMVCSYVNIIFVGLVAALVVGKAEYTGKLGHRVVFSDFCTLTSIPGRVGQYRLTFRMANVDNSVPLAHGQLRVFCVTAEPLREYRLRQKQMQLVKNSAPLEMTAKGSYGSPKQQQLLPSGEASNSLRGTAPLTEAMLEGRRVTHQKHRQHQSDTSKPAPVPAPISAAAAPLISSTQNNFSEALMPPLTANEVEVDVQVSRTQQQQRRRAPHSGRLKTRSKTSAMVPSSSLTGLAGSVSGSRRHRGRDQATSADADRKKEGNERRQKGPRSGDGGASSLSSLSSPRQSLSRTSSATSTDSHSSAVPKLAKTKSENATASWTAATTAAAASDATNSSTTSKANSDLYAASALGATAGSLSGSGANTRTFSPEAIAAAAVVQGAGAGAVQVQHEEDDREMERVHLRVQEMRWTCAEETYVDRGDSRQLSLWYPVTITHTIDERSPLYSFMQLPFMAAALKDGPLTAFGSARSDDSSVHPQSLSAANTNNRDAARHHFQLVAVFDATEMESSSTITAKHTYTTVDIVAHYKFSDRLVHMQSDSGEVMLDFHYFNALLPVDLVELSTTDSET